MLEDEHNCLQNLRQIITESQRNEMQLNPLSIDERY